MHPTTMFVYNIFTHTCLWLFLHLLLHPSQSSLTNLNLPVDWIEVSLDAQHTSMSTIVHSESGNIYLCGGKVSLYDKSSKCVAIHIERSSSSSSNYAISTRYSGGNGLRLTGPFPGVYLSAKAFLSETQNEGGIYTDRMCMLSMSDGSNKPKCLCCDALALNSNANPSSIKCDDLLYTPSGCPERYDACIVHDEQRHLLYQIGGYYGEQIYDSILCFDLATESYVTGAQCPFGALRTPMYGMGCTLLSAEGGGGGVDRLVVVGGLDTIATSTTTLPMDTIEVCRADGTQCESLPMTLDEGVLKTRLFAIDACHVGIVGGKIKREGSELISDHMHVADTCNAQWTLQNSVLPLPLTEMGVVAIDGILCLYGGVSYDVDTFFPLLSTSAYCTDIGSTTAPTSTVSTTTISPTPSPTAQPTTTPTQRPTSAPTVVPTSAPTLPEIASIALADSTFANEFAQFGSAESQGKSAAVCGADDQFMYVCGGYGDAASTVYNQCDVFDADGVKTTLDMYLYTNDEMTSKTTMPEFYCRHQCSVMYSHNTDAQLFLVNPTFVDTTMTQTNHAANILKCDILRTLDDGVPYVACTNLCANAPQFCQHIAATTDSCVTLHDEFMYISGGYDAQHRLSSQVAVLNMDTLQWTSVAESESESVALTVPVASHSCAYWNDTLYVLGGVDESGVALSTIQRCRQASASDNAHDCVLSSAHLSDARVDARSRVIGSSILTIGGTTTTTTTESMASDVVEVYDALSDVSASALRWTLNNGGRSAACLVDWRAHSLLLIAGGETWLDGSGADGVRDALDNIVYSEYWIEQQHVETVGNNQLLECTHIDVDTRDFSFKNVYELYDQMGDYYIFATTDLTAFLVIDASGDQNTWIYNYADKTSCYFESDVAGEIVDVGPGVWIKPRTRSTQTHSILIQLSCLDAAMSAVQSSGAATTTVLWGLTEAAFITCVVVGAVLLITVSLMAFCCWWRRSGARLKHEYSQQQQQRQRQRRGKKKRAHHKTSTISQHDEDDDESESESEPDEHADYGQTKVNIFGANVQRKKPRYMAAKSYSQISSNENITIVRRRDSSDVELQLQDTDKLRQQHISRIKSESSNEEAEEDAEQTMTHKSSCSTVDPYEVRFGAKDGNTALIDAIAHEVQQTRNYEAWMHERRTYSDIVPVYKPQIPHKAAQCVDDSVYMTPSDLRLEHTTAAVAVTANHASSPPMEPMMLHCPPPPPPVHAVINNHAARIGEAENDDDENGDNLYSGHAKNYLSQH